MEQQIERNAGDSKEIKKEEPVVKDVLDVHKPSGAFIAASWIAFLTGAIAFMVGLWNANMEMSQKGFFFVVLLFGLFSAISVQKSVRDKLEGIPVTDIYYGVSWFTTLVSIVLLIIGLWKSDLELSEKGFYGISFMMSMFSVIAVQKNVRDLAMF